LEYIKGQIGCEDISKKTPDLETKESM